MKKHSKSALATALGKSVKVIGDWVSAGCPHERTARGHYAFDLAEVLEWRERRAVEKVAVSIPKNSSVINLDQERARLAKERADKVAFENELERGNYVHIDDVNKSWQEIASIVRTKILALPHNLAPVLAAENNPAVCSELIRVAVYDALEEIADTKDTV